MCCGVERDSGDEKESQRKCAPDWRIINFTTMQRTLCSESDLEFLLPHSLSVWRPRWTRTHIALPMVA
jgi:hypothetical protein